MTYPMEPGSLEGKFTVPITSEPPAHSLSRDWGAHTNPSDTLYLPPLPPSSPYDHPETPSHPPAGTPTPQQPWLPMKAGARAFPLTQLSSPGSQRLGSPQCVKLM